MTNHIICLCGYIIGRKQKHRYTIVHANYSQLCDTIVTIIIIVRNLRILCSIRQDLYDFTTTISNLSFL